MRSNNEPVRIRYKDLANGTKSIYLDTYKSGKRSYEFLKLYLRPEDDDKAKAVKAETSLSLVIVLRKQIKLQELIRPLSTFVSVEINRLCAIRQILIAYAHRFIVTSHVTLLFILLIVILRDLLLTVQRYEK